MNPRLVILDRDGVINFDSPDYIKSPEEWVPIPGSIEAIARLHQHGVTIYVATNQAGIARGKLTAADLEAVHRKMRSTVSAAGGEIAGIQFCPHHPDDNCDCRKPAPGMLLAIEALSGIPLDGQPYVGDSMKDICAANAAGCEPVLVLTGNGRETAKMIHPGPAIFKDLATFTDYYLAQTFPGKS